MPRRASRAQIFSPASWGLEAPGRRPKNTEPRPVGAASYSALILGAVAIRFRARIIRWTPKTQQGFSNIFVAGLAPLGADVGDTRLERLNLCA